MISYIYKKSFAVLMKRPVRLWGVSLLCIFLTGLASASFSLLPPAGFVVTVALETSMAMIFLNCYRTGLEPRTTYLFSTFTKDRFLHVVGGMAWMYLWIFLWSLIPVAGIVFGTIRAYEYRFTPYILMTRSDVKPTEAIEVSKKETMGYKSTMFWADVLVEVIIGVAALLLSLLGKIPYVGVLFVIVLIALSVFCALFLSLFYGILHAAFYVEIKSGNLSAQAAPAPQYAPAPSAPQPVAPVQPAPAAPAPAPAPAPAAPAAPAQPEPAAPEAPAAPAAAPDQSEPAAPEAAPAAPAAPAATFCTNCGAKLEPGARFCTVCGAKQE